MPSEAAFADRASGRELKEAPREARMALWQKAIAGSVFLRDVADIEVDFAAADAESARAIKRWGDAPTSPPMRCR